MFRFIFASGAITFLLTTSLASFAGPEPVYVQVLEMSRILEP